MPRKVIIIRGYCGSGKSSVAKHLAKKNEFAFLEYDNFLWNMNTTKKPSKFEYEIAFRNFLSVLKNYLTTKKYILIEGPLVPRTKDDPFEIKKVVSIIKNSNCELRIFQLIANETVCIQRMKKRNHVVPKWERDMFKQKHDDSIQKNEIVIDTSNLTLQQTVNNINKHL